MEQTVLEAVQQASGTGPWTWLQSIAAFGTLISLITLGITIWNSLTRIRITVGLNDPTAQERVLVARIVNKSKIPLFVDHVYLESSDGQQLTMLDKWGDYQMKHIQPHTPMRFRSMGDMSWLARILLEQGYQNSAGLLIVVVDGIGRHRGRQPMEIKGLEEWAEGKASGPEPIALRWYRRWFL